MTVASIGIAHPPIDILTDAVHYLLQTQGIGSGGNVPANLANAVTSNSQTGEIMAGNLVLSYLYQYMGVRYANSANGVQDFSPFYSGANYIGLYNTANNTQASENPTDYVWRPVADGGFGATRNPYYLTRGGRALDIIAAEQPPAPIWDLIPTAANNFINLDIISTANGISGTSVYQATLYGISTIPDNPPAPEGGSWNFATGQAIPPPLQRYGASGIVFWSFSPYPPQETIPYHWISSAYFVSADPQGTAVNPTWTIPVPAAQDGQRGDSFLTVTAYADSIGMPGTPYDGQFNFVTSQFDPPSGDVTWYTEPPGGSNIWASYALASTVGTPRPPSPDAYVDQLGNNWSTPVLLSVTGAAGRDGLSTYQWPIYRESNVGTPATPTGGVYNFSNPVNSLFPTGWFGSAEQAAGQAGEGVVYISQGLATQVGPSGNSTNIINWTAPIQYLGANGIDGTNGVSTFQWPIYRYSLAQPTITGDATWSFQTDTGVPPVNWFNDTNGIGNNRPIWVSTALVVGATPTSIVTVPANAWTTPTQWSGPTGPAGQPGQDGRDGANAALVLQPYYSPNPVNVVSNYGGNVQAGGGVLPTVIFGVTVDNQPARLANSATASGQYQWAYTSILNSPGITLGPLVNGAFEVAIPVTSSTQQTANIVIQGLRGTRDGNIANSTFLGSNVTIQVTQIRQGQAPGWYEVNYSNTFPALNVSDTGNLVTAWRLEYNIVAPILPADASVIKFNQLANINPDGSFLFTESTEYLKWSSAANSFSEFSTLLDGGVIIPETLDVLDAAVGNSIQSTNFTYTQAPGGGSDTTVPPQFGWQLTKDGRLYGKQAYLDGGFISNVQASSITSGQFTATLTSTTAGGSIVISGGDPLNPNQDPTITTTDNTQVLRSVLGAGSLDLQVRNPSGSDYISRAPLAQVVSGTDEQTNTNITIPGIFLNAPSILVSASSLQTYSSSLGSTNQFLSVTSGAPFRANPATQPYTWTFRATATLTTGASMTTANPTATPSPSSNDYSSASPLQSSGFPIPAATNQVSVTLTTNSIKAPAGNAGSNVVLDRILFVRLRVGTSVGTAVQVNINSINGTTQTISVPVPTTNAGSARLEFWWQDKIPATTHAGNATRETKTYTLAFRPNITAASNAITAGRLEPNWPTNSGNPVLVRGVSSAFVGIPPRSEMLTTASGVASFAYGTGSSGARAVGLDRTGASTPGNGGAFAGSNSSLCPEGPNGLLWLDIPVDITESGYTGDHNRWAGQFNWRFTGRMDGAKYRTSFFAYGDVGISYTNGTRLTTLQFFETPSSGSSSSVNRTWNNSIIAITSGPPLMSGALISAMRINLGATRRTNSSNPPTAFAYPSVFLGYDGGFSLTATGTFSRNREISTTPQNSLSISEVTISSQSTTTGAAGTINYIAIGS